MKTVQDWLCEVDENELADTYLSYYPPPFYAIAQSEKTVREITEAIRGRFLDFVRRMRTVETRQEGEPYLFFASEEFEEGEKRIRALLIRREDAFASGDVQTYSWIMTDHAEVMGCPLADTELARENIHEILSEILHEATFWGYTQEKLEEERARLEASLAEAEGGKAIPAEEVFRELGLQPKRECKEAKALEQEIHRAIHAYNAFCRERELAKVRELLRREAANP